MTDRIDVVVLVTVVKAEEVIPVPKASYNVEDLKPFAWKPNQSVYFN